MKRGLNYLLVSLVAIVPAMSLIPLCSCSINDSKINITPMSQSPKLTHNGDVVFLTANVPGGYSHAIKWDYTQLEEKLGKKFKVSFSTKNLFNDTIRIETLKNWDSNNTNVTIYASNDKSTASFNFSLINAQTPIVDSESFSIDYTYSYADYFSGSRAITPFGEKLTGDDVISATNALIEDTSRAGELLHIYMSLLFTMFDLEYTGIPAKDAPRTGEAWLTRSNDGTNTPLFNCNIDNPSGDGFHMTNLLVSAPYEFDESERGRNVVELIQYYPETDYTLRNITNVSGVWAEVNNDVALFTGYYLVEISKNLSSQRIANGCFDTLTSFPSKNDFDIVEDTNLYAVETPTSDAAQNFVYQGDNTFINFYKKNEISSPEIMNFSIYLDANDYKKYKSVGKSGLYTNLINKYSGSTFYNTTQDKMTQIEILSTTNNPNNKTRYETRPWMFFGNINVEEYNSFKANNMIQTTYAVCFSSHANGFSNLSGKASKSYPDGYTKAAEVEENQLIRYFHFAFNL